MTDPSTDDPSTDDPSSRPASELDADHDAAATEMDPNADMFWAGFGASAGGLEALRSVLRALPDDANITYLVAQHLAPQHKSVLTELLGRETKLTVAEAADDLIPQPNTVYVTPPNTDVIAQNGRLRLLPPSPQTAAPKPSVDRLLMSLAADRGDKAIGVILSGTGSDGAYGIKAVRAAGGVTIAQDAASARYYGMPSAALSTDNVDLILPASEIGGKLHRIISSPRTKNFSSLVGTDSDELGQVYYLLQSHTKNDFRGYKETTIRRRIERRMQALGISSLSEYVDALNNSEAEISALFSDLLITVTSFFRDEQEFETFDAALRTLIENRGDASLRIWVPACATGEEAYSIAMLATEAMGGLANVVGSGRLKIFATDLDGHALSAGRHGVYPEAALDSVPEHMKATYFDRSGSLCTATRELRSLIVFSMHNLLQDPPFLNLDVISCRNLLIYFQPTLQERVTARFHYALNEGGLLFLGRSETITGSERLFRRAGKRGNVFTPRFASDAATLADVKANALRPLATPARRSRRVEPTPETEMFDAVVAALGPDALLANSDLDVLKSYGDVGAYTTLAPGAVSTALSSLIVPDLRHELCSMAARSLREGRSMTGLTHRDDAGRMQVRIYPLQLPRQQETVLLIVFARIEEAEPDDADIVEIDQGEAAAMVRVLEQELTETRENLQQTVEELETTNEELQAANEELQTSNEEFQATNEELETSNEELQSTNEELITVNDELNTTAEELRWATKDLENILEHSPTPIMVVTSDLVISRLSDEARRFFKIPEAPDNPHVSQVPMQPGMPPLSQIVTDALATGAPFEQYVDSDAFAARFSARRYVYGRSNEVAVVIAVVELTQLIQNRRELQQLFDLAPVAILEQSAEGRVLRQNATMDRYLGADMQAALFAAHDPVFQALASDQRLSDDDRAAPDVRQVTGADGIDRWIRISRRFVDHADDRLSRTYAIGTDVTELVATQRSLREQTSLLKMSQKLGRLGHWRLTLDDGAVYWSDELFRLAGEEPEFFRPTRENMLQFYPEQDRDMISAAIETAIAHQEPFSLTAKLKSRSGARRIVDWSGRPEIGPDGSVSALIGIVRDMTTIHEREAELRRTLDDLGRSNAELSRFSYVCSHDMREPVRTIASMVELLKDEASGDDLLSAEERADLIDRIQQNAKSLLQIIEGLLAFSRLEGKREITNVDVRALVDEVIDAVKPAFADQRIAFDISELPIIQGTELHLRQLFQNLIVNGIKFSQTDQVMIRISAKEEEHHWRFAVEDNGNGVQKEFREEIFMMFRRLDRKDQGSGSGLGLGISKRIVEQHGGEIWCEDSPLGGAAFVFRLTKALDDKRALK